jgi:Protein of unknown function (DUF1634)
MSEPARLEGLLAGVLQWGSWAASAAIGVGCVLALVGPHVATPLPGVRVVTLGIALFILLPVVRVALMLIVFLRERDYRLGAVAALVLAIMFVGFALGSVHV